MVRDVLALLWRGAELVHRLSFAPSDVAAMPADTVVEWLKYVGVTVPATEQEQRDRLAAFPTVTDLDALARARIGANDGVRPTVRVIERVPSRRATGVGGAGGPAGSPPPRPGPVTW